MKTKIIFLLLITVLHVQAEIRFVSKTGTSKPPYTSWATAADSIQKAIDFCSAGDTVVVANGVYKEALWVKKVITLLGTSMDSTIIDVEEISGPKERKLKIYFEDTALIKNFTLRTIYNLYDDSTIFITCNYKNLNIENCKFINGKYAIEGYKTNFYINNCIFSNLEEECIASNYFYNSGGVTSITNCIFTLGNGICYSGSYANHIFINNIISSLNAKFSSNGVNINFADKIDFINNIMVDLYIGLYFGGYCKYTNVLNNTFINSEYLDLYVNSESFLIKNNIFTNGETGIRFYSLSKGIEDYNLFWKKKTNISGSSIIGPHNLFLDPMFVVDSSSINGHGDYHLQKYSPAIDAGDPDIKDADGSRSDIGAYGGQFGESYIYKDLAPRAPVNLKIEDSVKRLNLKWNKNSEADFAFYRIYRDTVKNFKADLYKKIAEITDTNYFDNKPVKNSVYYKITAYDKQGNESALSEEAGYIITGVETRKIIAAEYALYQNYPNPFNPKTKIGYKLKEKGKVRLTLYDIQGKLVETILNNEERTIGYYEEEFPKQNKNMLASGIYLCRIEILNAGGIPVFNDSIKMLYLK